MGSDDEEEEEEEVLRLDGAMVLARAKASAMTPDDAGLVGRCSYSLGNTLRCQVVWEWHWFGSTTVVGWFRLAWSPWRGVLMANILVGKKAQRRASTVYNSPSPVCVKSNVLVSSAVPDALTDGCSARGGP